MGSAANKSLASSVLKKYSFSRYLQCTPNALIKNICTVNTELTSVQASLEALGNVRVLGTKSCFVEESRIW